MDTIRARNARFRQLTNEQQEIIIGSLLGDGYLVATTRGYAFRVNHSIAQQAYVDWKYDFLKEFTNSKPRIYQNSYYFRTVSHPFFEKLRYEFYVGKRKRVPRQLSKWISPLILSVWLMDDGARDKGQLRLNTQCFSREENQTLVGILEAKLGISATLNRDKKQFRLRVKEVSMPRVRQLVSRYLLPSMQYKLSP